jgi:hypothetical protein
MAKRQTCGYWFEDPRDPRLARWFDGRRPTDHTIWIADLAEGEVPPPPLDVELTAEPAATPAARRAVPGRRAPQHAVRRTDPEPEPGGEPIPDFLWGAQRPWWTVLRLRLVAGACASFLVVVAAIGLHLLPERPGDGGRQELQSQNAGSRGLIDPAELDAAVTRALGSGTNGLTADGLRDLLPLACTAIEAKTPTQLAGRLSMYRFTSPELSTLVRALKVGARELCDDAVRAFQDFFDEVVPMVLVANPSTDAVQLGGDAVTTGGVVSTGGTIVAGSATATGSVTSSPGASSVTSSSGSTCSVPGASSTVVGGTAICSSVSCEGTGTSSRWRTTSC